MGKSGKLKWEQNVNRNLITQDPPWRGCVVRAGERGGSLHVYLISLTVVPWSVSGLDCGPVPQHLELRACVCSRALAPYATGSRRGFTQIHAHAYVQGAALNRSNTLTHTCYRVTKSQTQHKEWIHQYGSNQLHNVKSIEQTKRGWTWGWNSYLLLKHTFTLKCELILGLISKEARELTYFWQMVLEWLKRPWLPN